MKGQHLAFSNHVFVFLYRRDAEPIVAGQLGDSECGGC